MLKIRCLQSGYDNLKVLKSISLHIETGEIVTLIGANGAGKSTLVKTITGLVKASSGKIVFDKKDISRTRTEKIAGAGCVLVPEGRHIFQTMTVRENLMLGAFPLSVKVPSSQRKDIEKRELEKVFTLFPKLLERKNQLGGTLSGGEQQMLAIGRALMSQPKLLILDEPSTGLAPIVVKEIFKVIKGLRESGMTILLIEQNARAALGIADRGYAIETGQIMMEGEAAMILKNKDIQRAYLGKDYKAMSDLDEEVTR